MKTNELIDELRKMASQYLSPNAKGKAFFLEVAERLEYLKLHRAPSSAMEEAMAADVVRVIYLEIIEKDYGGSFLKNFARSVVNADAENFQLLYPAATALILKYDLINKLSDWERKVPAEAKP